MASTSEDSQPDPRVGSEGDRRVRKIDWLWEQIGYHQRKVRLLEIELARTENDEYLDDSVGLDQEQAR